MSLNVHIHPSPMIHDSRILKITKTLAENKVFDKIILLGIGAERLPRQKKIDEKREIIRLGSTFAQDHKNNFFKAIKILLWSWHVFTFLLPKKVTCINCHNLAALPICALLKALKGSKLVYDTHELETETVGNVGWRKLISKGIEYSLIRFADATVVVNRSIAAWYMQTYNLPKVWVVQNVPYRFEGEIQKTTLLREKFSLKPTDLIYLYQGIFGEGRGLRSLLQTFAELSSQGVTDKHLVCMGYGTLVPILKEFATKYPNIHYQEAVPPDVVLEYTASADVGLSLGENICLSYYLSLPNKIFEYLTVGLPVIASDFPEMGKVIDTYNCGWKVPPTFSQIKPLVEKLSLGEIEQKRPLAFQASRQFGWHLEEAELIDLYQHLGLAKRLN
jgi:glycosyltransferase involved in cell wall biosynthesis